MGAYRAGRRRPCGRRYPAERCLPRRASPTPPGAATLLSVAYPAGRCLPCWRPATLLRGAYPAGARLPLLRGAYPADGWTLPKKKLEKKFSGKIS